MNAIHILRAMELTAIQLGGSGHETDDKIADTLRAIIERAELYAELEAEFEPRNHDAIMEDIDTQP